MTRKTFLGAAALAGALAIAFGAGAQVRKTGGDSFNGSVSVGRMEQFFNMPGGITAMGKLGDPRRWSDARELRFIPRYYGDLVGISSHGDLGALWFKDPTDGTIRNVPIPEPGRRIFAIQMQAATIRQTNY